VICAENIIVLVVDVECPERGFSRASSGSVGARAAGDFSTGVNIQKLSRKSKEGTAKINDK
jgi:hypothetical protein